jgi:hypothetical protein
MELERGRRIYWRMISWRRRYIYNREKGGYGIYI